MVAIPAAEEDRVTVTAAIDLARANALDTITALRAAAVELRRIAPDAVCVAARLDDPTIQLSAPPPGVTVEWSRHSPTGRPYWHWVGDFAGVSLRGCTADSGEARAMGCDESLLAPASPSAVSSEGEGSQAAGVGASE